MQVLALPRLPHNKKFKSLLVPFFMCSLYLLGFSPSTPVSSHVPKTCRAVLMRAFQMTLGVNVSVNGCLGEPGLVPAAPVSLKRMSGMDNGRMEVIWSVAGCRDNPSLLKASIVLLHWYSKAMFVQLEWSDWTHLTGRCCPPLRWRWRTRGRRKAGWPAGTTYCSGG